MISKINLPPKLILCYISTLKKPIELYESKEDPLIQLIKEYSEIDKFENEILSKKMEFFYLNRKNVLFILYEKDQNINIKSNDEYHFSDLFYLILLIEENINIVNFEYSFDFVENIENIFRNDNSKNDLIKLKIIYNLTQNIDLDRIRSNEFIKETEKIIDSLGIIKELNLYRNVNINNIFGKKIDEIYGDILEALIKTNKIVNYDYAYKIIKQLDLENIDITETIFNKLSKILNNADFVKNYEIIFTKDDKNNKLIDDLNNNEKKINFYYILFKYILKYPQYIYQITFLLKARQIITKNETFLSLSKHDGEIRKKLLYIYSFFCDVSINYIKNLINNNNYSENESKSKITKKSRQSESTFNEEIVDYPIIKLKKILIISDRKKNSNFFGFMKQMNNGIIIAWGEGDSITIIKDNLEIKKISYSNKLNIELSSEEKKEIKEYKKTFNVVERRNNSDSNKIEIMDFSGYALLEYEINIETGKITLKKQNKKISCKDCFEIFKEEDSNHEIECYVTYGEKGIGYLDKELNKNKIKIKIKTPYSGGIKISDKLIAITSNSILPNGEDKLDFYDIEQKKIVQTINGSFVNNLNGLSLVKIKVNETKEYKILICACKKYLDEQKNGILLIKPNLQEDEDLSYKFHRTENFEVNCICPINQSEDKNNKIFFFAGGLDIDKKLGMLKLFKFIYDHESNRFYIEFLQDIVIEAIQEFKGFESSITCMIQNKKDGNILVGTSDGKKVYVFSEPNLKYYIEEYEEKQFHLFNKKTY